MFLGFYAVTQLPLATATTLEYTAPLFIVLGMLLVARRQVTVVEVCAMAIGFAGVLLLLRPTLRGGQAVPFAAGLMSGICAAVAYGTLRKLGGAGEPGWRIVLFYSLSAASCALPVVAFAGLSSYTPKSAMTLAGIGAIGLLSQLTMTQAFRVGSTARLATLQYTTVLFSAAYGIIFWEDQLSLAMAAGLTLIVVSGIVVMDRHVPKAGNRKP